MDHKFTKIWLKECNKLIFKDKKLVQSYFDIYLYLSVNN